MKKTIHTTFLTQKIVTLVAAIIAVTAISTAKAAIIFQDDDFNTVESASTLLGSNDAGTTNTSIQFGNDLTGSENGNIIWNITTNHFNFDHTIDITGGLTATGNISTSGSGTITSAGLLTGSNGLTLTTGALNMTSTSGALSLSGLTGSSISTGSNGLNFTSSNFNTTSSGINSTAIGATTPSTGAFTTLSANTRLTLPNSTGASAPILKHLSVTQANVTSANIGAATCGTYATITVTGAAVGDSVISTPEAQAGGIETVNLIWSTTISAANTVIIRACNSQTLTAINTADTQTWNVDVWGH